MSTTKVEKDPPRLSIPWYSRVYGVSVRLLYAEIAAGRLRTRKVGQRRTIILEQDWLRYLDRPVEGAMQPQTPTSKQLPEHR
jgi:hypothetical protein